MRIAALYDIHGNLPALEAVLDEVEQSGVDLIVFGGDAVAGPLPRETLERIMALRRPTAFIRGNADREIVETFDRADPHGVQLAPPDLLQWYAGSLDGRHRDVLASWPLLYSAAVDGIGEVLFCHASPRNDVDIFTRHTPDAELAPLLDGISQPTIVVGHTHMQFDRQVAGKRVINAGSVGMPYGGAAATAFWLLLGPDVELRRTAYDGEAAAALTRATSYPQAESFAATNILAPPSEQQALAAFERIKGRLTG